jgi:nucleotide-binding universal stress UspA family protein
MDKPLPKTILVATDFSDGSNEALQRAIALARLSGGTLEIVHVIEPGVEDPFGGHIYGSDHHSAVDRMLMRLTAEVEAGGLACTAKILEGNAAIEIVNRARTIGAATIVVGTHGRTGLAHVVLGSIAERVVRHAACPVLTVPFSKKVAA